MTNYLKLSLLTLAVLFLSACGSKPAPAVTAPTISREEFPECERVTEHLKRERVRWYETDGSETIKDVVVWNCSAGSNGLHVEFRFSKGGWGYAVHKEAGIQWPTDGRIPDYFNTNLNCQAQSCSRE